MGTEGGGFGLCLEIHLAEQTFFESAPRIRSSEVAERHQQASDLLLIMSVRDRYLLQSTASLLSNLLLFLNSMYAAGIITQKLASKSPPANLQSLPLR